MKLDASMNLQCTCFGMFLFPNPMKLWSKITNDLHWNMKHCKQQALVKSRLHQRGNLPQMLKGGTL
jgi:hypothetical protein